MEFDRYPSLRIFHLRVEDESEAVCGPLYEWYVLLVKTAEYHDTSLTESFDISGEVGEDYIAVDVGEENVSRLQLGERGGITLYQIDADIIECDVFTRVVTGSRVYFDTGDIVGSTHGGQNGQYAGAGAHINDLFMPEVHAEQMAYHHAGGGVMTGAESHLRVNDNVVFSVRHIFVESAVDNAFAFNLNGLEIIAFPFLIPVSALNFLKFHLELCLHGKLLQYALYRVGPEECVVDICEQMTGVGIVVLLRRHLLE